jgi:hypothetical protein
MKKLVLTPSVEIAIRTLSHAGRSQVFSWFDHLQNWDSDEHVRKISHQLVDIPGVRVLQTSGEIRIFFRIDGDTITILDVAKKAAIVSSGQTTGDK